MTIITILILDHLNLSLTVWDKINQVLEYIKGHFSIQADCFD